MQITCQIFTCESNPMWQIGIINLKVFEVTLSAYATKILNNLELRSTKKARPNFGRRSHIVSVSLMMWINHESSHRSSICRRDQVNMLRCYAKRQHCSIKVAPFRCHRRSVGLLACRAYVFI